MTQIARNMTTADWSVLAPGQHLTHDRDGKYCPAFQQIIEVVGVKQIPLPHRGERQGPIRCRERLGGLLKYYSQEAA